MIPHYHINVFWSDKDECWTADVPDLAKCSARGGSAEDVVTLVQQAMVDWVAAARNEGSPVPEPSYHPEPA